ncbi:MAG: hypothetical protein KatS3mg062_0900 [Tepidiforma sp.]|nr:MAG: hypothetical protein KatS3mg062_0900 [Tepidiforma sp.]
MTRRVDRKFVVRCAAFALERPLRCEVNLDVRPPKPVNRLLRVPDEEQPPRRDVGLPPLPDFPRVARDQRRQLNLERVRVLELVDEQLPKPPVQRLANLPVPPQQIDYQHQQVVECHPSRPEPPLRKHKRKLLHLRQQTRQRPGADFVHPRRLALFDRPQRPLLPHIQPDRRRSRCQREQLEQPPIALGCGRLLQPLVRRVEPLRELPEFLDVFPGRKRRQLPRVNPIQEVSQHRPPVRLRRRRLERLPPQPVPVPRESPRQQTQMQRPEAQRIGRRHGPLRLGVRFELIEELPHRLPELNLCLRFVQHVELRGQPRLHRVLRQHLPREGVDRLERRPVERSCRRPAPLARHVVPIAELPAPFRRLLEPLPNSIRQLCCRLLRERNRSNPVHRHPLPDEVHDPVHQRRRLSRPGARLDEQRLPRFPDRQLPVPGITGGHHAPPRRLQIVRPPPPG